MDRIPVAGPSITEDDALLVADAVRTDWQDQAGTYERRFETEFAEHIGVQHALALPSCTSAIHLSLTALGIGPGDEVIVPDVTWIASAVPITYLGATPVFADISRETWCLSPEAFAQSITPRTRAVMVVNLYGGMPDMASLQEIAGSHGIPIVEDAAQAIGAAQHGSPAGSFGHTGVFSFHGSKTLTTGEGGMLVTNDAALYERCQFLRNHGRPPGDRHFVSDEIAYKYRMSAMQAALGLSQLQRVQSMAEKKRTIFQWYAERLAQHPDIQLNPTLPHTTNGCWMVTALIAPRLGLGKRQLMAALDEKGIDSRPFLYPLSSLPAFAHLPDLGAGRTRNTVAYDISPWGVNLPSGLQLTREDVSRVCEALLSILEPSSARA